MGSDKAARTLIATAAFGLESVVASELHRLGYGDLATENGKVTFPATDADIARCNINLRCADRVLLQMGQFRATDFEELFQGVKAIPWEGLIPENGVMHVTGKSVRSKLFSVPDCQSIAKKAVVEAMKRRYRTEKFPENGPVYRIEVALLKDVATISVDTSGPGLHKRGYRSDRGTAPLRETLAAALVLLSRWRPDQIFADPFCGSGTIAVEAALIGRNIAPGINRSFAAEDWPHLSRQLWMKAHDEARAAVRSDTLQILASDHDWSVFKMARENAERAGVAEAITFQKKPLAEFSSKKRGGVIVCNPPYGERMGDTQAAERLYEEMGRIFPGLPGWAVYVLTAHEEFEKFYGKKSDKNRKLYNGKIKCHLYQYTKDVS